MKLTHTLLFASFAFISACSGHNQLGTAPLLPSNQHIQRDDSAPTHGSNDIPQANKRVVPLPAPKPNTKIETYSVVVTNVPAQEILFALARDAKINLDITSGIEGNVTINAINQTLPQILDRISKQVDMRYEFDNGTLLVMPDKPFLKTYKIDFINMKRSSDSSSTTTAAISGAGTPPSQTKVTSFTENNLMVSLIDNVTKMLIDEDKLHYYEQIDLQNKQNIFARGDGMASGSSDIAGSSGGQNNQANNGGQM